MKPDTITVEEAARQQLENERARASDAVNAVTQLAGVIQRLATPPDRRTLDARMAAVQAELEDVPRRGHAEVQTKQGGRYSYDYITEADLMSGIRPLLAKHGIATYYRDRIVKVENGMATVEVELELRAGGEVRVLHGEGVGTDMGDKHANKAKTSAMRYLLWKTFLQPSDDDDDPEQENVSADAAKAAEEARTARHEARTPRPPAARGRGRDPQARRGELRQRLNQLAVELDEVQGNPPGRSISTLADAVRADYELSLDAAPEQLLVKIGTALAEHVTEQRAKAERGETADDAFTLPGRE